MITKFHPGDPYQQQLYQIHFTGSCDEHKNKKEEKNIQASLWSTAASRDRQNDRVTGTEGNGIAILRYADPATA